MKKSEIKILKVLSEFEKLTLKQLANILNCNTSFCSRVLKDLQKKGIVSCSVENGKKYYYVLRNPYTNLLLEIIKEFSNLLGGKREILLSALTKELNLKEIQLKTQLSLKQIIEYLEEFQSQGIVVEKNGKYTIARDKEILITFFKLKEMENLNVVWERGEEKLFYSSEKMENNCTLTAFSLFPKFGVQVYQKYFYYYSPKSDISLEEIFIHSLKFSKDKNDFLLCIIFYLKNKYFFDPIKLRILARKYQVREILTNIFELLEKKKQIDFLPSYEELRRKARIYGINLDFPLSGEEKLRNLFLNLDMVLKENLKIFLIGGSAMILRKLKSSTKDIDVILESKRDLEILRNALSRLNFTFLRNIFENPYYRIDVYVKRVLKGFELSEEMKRRASLFYSGKFLKVYILSNEDLFLFKSYSGREGDLEDCKILAEKKLDWKIILEECLSQERRLNKLFSITLLDMLYALKDYDVKAPNSIFRKLQRHCTEELIKEELKKRERSIKELVFLLDIPEPTVRKIVKDLESRGVIEKIKAKRGYKYNIA